MPNFASALKEEIVRLARKELKKELGGLKKASAFYRAEIASLKRRVLVLERHAKHLTGKVAPQNAPQENAEATTRVRFSAKGLATKRKNLGLSATDMGMLLGVSAQTIYHWETEKSRPRPQQVLAIATMRKMGKREIEAYLSSRRHR